jgi:predicted AlkP superfamily phosphohydrolase/phosphomutase
VAPAPAAAPVIAPMTSRLILIDLDGADLEDILTLMSAGKLPAFARLRRDGSYGRLQAFVPCAGAVARTTLATGRLPYRSGVRAAWARDLLGRPLGIQVVPDGIGFDLLLAPFLSRRALTIDDRTGPAIWDIAAIAGGASVASGWNVVLDVAGPPPEPSRELRRRLVTDFLEGESPAGEGAGELLAELGRAVGADESVARVLSGAGRAPGVTALAFPGIDRVAHRFLRYARPEEFGNVSNAEIEIWGHVMERYYARLDGFLGRALDARGDDGWLFVASAHGMEPAPLRRRLAAALIGREATAGYHDQAPPGFLFALGPGVHAGQPFGRASITDVVPTALYVLGLPIARDLDGSIVEQVMGAGEVLERPAAVIDTYGPRP